MEQVWEWILGTFLSDNVMMTVLVAPVVIFFELRRPASNAPLRHYLFGIRFWLANLVVLALIAPTLNAAVARGIQGVGLGLIDLRVAGLGGLGGSLLALLISTFVLDFFYYWFHRTLHANRWLWQTHLLHHSDEHMNAMTAQRGHFAEGLIAPFLITLPMAVLFDLPAVTIGVLSVIPYAYQFIAHANIRLGYGRFWWVLISPDYHRIHHSIEERHRDKNFTNWFPVWDWLFGTLYLPGKDERPQTGVDGVEVRTLGAAFALPVIGWIRLLGLRGPRVVRQSQENGSLPAGESSVRIGS